MGTVKSCCPVFIRRLFEKEERTMFVKSEDIKPFESKVWLASPTMHGEELKYMAEAYETNWMSTVGENINEVERIAAEKAEVRYAVGLSCCIAAFLHGSPACYSRASLWFSRQSR